MKKFYEKVIGELDALLLKKAAEVNAMPVVSCERDLAEKELASGAYLLARIKSEYNSLYKEGG